jgi:hypothetical protein
MAGMRSRMISLQQVCELRRWAVSLVAMPAEAIAAANGSLQYVSHVGLFARICRVVTRGFGARSWIGWGGGLLSATSQKRHSRRCAPCTAPQDPCQYRACACSGGQASRQATAAPGPVSAERFSSVQYFACQGIGLRNPSRAQNRCRHLAACWKTSAAVASDRAGSEPSPTL